MHLLWNNAIIFIGLSPISNCKHSTQFYISSTGSSDFELMPIRFPNGTLCDYLNTTYKKYFMEDLKYPVSNMPYSNNMEENFCDVYRSNESVSGRGKEREIFD